MATDANGVDWGLIVSIIALGASAVTFYFGYTRSKKSEQVHISREIWSGTEGIEDQLRIIHEWPFSIEKEPTEPDFSRLKRALNSLKTDLGYYMFFVEKGEIKDPHVLEYYGKRMNDVYGNVKFIVVKFFFNQYWLEKDVDAWLEKDVDVKLWGEFRAILWMILKYRMMTGVNMYTIDGDMYYNEINWDNNKITIGGLYGGLYGGDIVRQIWRGDFDNYYEGIGWQEMTRHARSRDVDEYQT